MRKYIPVFTLPFLSLLFFFFIFTSQASPVSATDVACTWEQVQNPNPGSSNTLHGISAISASDIWAVGTYIGDTGDRPWAQHWDGTNWSTVESPDVITNFWDVKAISTDDVWAVGLDGLIEHWDGSTWSEVTRPMPVTTLKTLRAVDGIASNDVWAVGYYLNGSNVQSLILHWNGTAWSIVPSPNANNDTGILYDLAVVSANDVWAVGYHGLIMHWNGSVWSVVSNPLTQTDYLLGIDALSTNDVWAVGYRNATGTAQNIVTHWDGSSWTIIPSPNNGTSHNLINNLDIVSANDIWAVGNYGPGVFTHQNDQAFTMHWDGSQWTMVPNLNPSSTTHNLYDVAIASDYIWTVGSYQNIGTTYSSLQQCSPANIAPVIDQITVDDNSVLIGSQVTAVATFSDENVLDDHTATWDWGDGVQTTGTLTESNGLGSVTNAHTYSQTGTYTIALTVTDNHNAQASQIYQYITVYNPPPTVGQISVDNNPLQTNSPLTATATFSDEYLSDTHTASWDWGDGTQTNGTVAESNGSGSVTDSHVYTQPGVYVITLTVIDSGNAQGIQTYEYVSVYNPTPNGLFSVARMYTSPVDAIAQNLSFTGPAKIGIMAKYDGVVPTGKVMMTIKDADIDFESTNISLLVIFSSNASLRGTGIYNGVPGYTFLATGHDEPDNIRLQIKDPFGNTVYDTQPGAIDIAEPITPITVGHVIIH